MTHHWGTVKGSEGSVSYELQFIFHHDDDDSLFFKVCATPATATGRHLALDHMHDM